MGWNNCSRRAARSIITRIFCSLPGRASVCSFGSEPGRKDVRSAIIARLRFRRLDSGKLVPKGELGSKDKLDGSSQPSGERLAPKAYHKKDEGNRERRVR